MTSLAGRESQVFRLGAAWGRATRGHTGLVLLAGAAGVGKTSLAREADRLAAGTGGAVRWARHEPYDHAVADAVRTARAGSPVLLVLDDLQHAGAATVELLRELAGGSDGRLLVLGCVRTPDGDAVLAALDGVATRLDVPPPAVRRGT